MRIGIDCRLAGRRHAGIGRYVTQLVRQLVQLKSDYTWVLTVNSQDQADELLPNHPDSVEWAMVAVRHYTLREQLIMPLVFAQQNLDLLHVPHFNLPVLYRGKSIITIHDLLWHQQRGLSVTTLPAWQYWLKYWMYRHVVKHAVQNAQLIITPSWTVKDQIAAFYPNAESKIKRVAEGVFVHPLVAQPPKIKLPNNYLLYVGSLYPHKNLQLVLKAMQLMPKAELVIVSARSAFTDQITSQIKRLNLDKRVHLFTDVDDAQLTAIYQKSQCLIQPSLSEGFGLTGLEAMACGTQVLASNIPVFKEVYGAAAQFFDPTDVNSLVKILKQLKPMTALQKKKLLDHAAQYSWTKMASAILKHYQTCLNQK